MQRVGSKLIVKIEKMAIGGSGIARHNGLVIFVPFSAPQDLLEITLTKSHKTYAEGVISKILEPSPFRINPPCPVYGKCGGCNWQHISQAEQLNQKRILVTEALEKSTRKIQSKHSVEIVLPEVKVHSSPKQYNYRNRIQLKYKSGKLGFFARETHNITPIDNCLIAEDPLNSKISECRKMADQNLNDGKLHKIELKLDSNNSVSSNLFVDYEDTEGFSQVNQYQNYELVNYVLSLITEKYEHIYELYCGSGNFTFPIYEKLKVNITGVELNNKLVQKAREKGKGKPSLKFEVSDVEQYLDISNLKSESLILLDPPRTGSSLKIMEKIAESSPSKMIYISCHPITLARDLEYFFDHINTHQKYKISSAAIFEMFPQTDHVETVLELTSY